MTWTQRVKSALKTFKRVALPMYGWTFIFVGLSLVLLFAFMIESISRIPWASLLTSAGSISPDLANSAAMPSMGLFEPGQAQFDQYSNLLSNPSGLLSTAGTIGGIFFLISIVAIVIGSLFWAGQFNLTAKAYREKVGFGDFRLSGFLRIIVWQVMLFLIYLILTVLSVLVFIALGNFSVARAAFFMIYGVIFILIQLYTLPWLFSSMYYILAHPEQGLGVALRGSWGFFKRHMGALWGYIGTVLLIEIAFLFLIKISVGLQFLVSLVVMPFIMVLAIVWVLSLDDNDRLLESETRFIPTPTSTYTSSSTSTSYRDASYPETAVTIEDTLVPVSRTNNPTLKSEETKISLQKEESLPPISEDKPEIDPPVL